MNYKEVINRIKNKKLPLDKNILSSLRTICLNNPNFISLNDVSGILRRDWLNLELDLEDRATKNISVESHIWREELENQCEKVVSYFLSSNYNIRREGVTSLLIWRAGLSFTKSLTKERIKIFHVRMKRDEETLQIEMILPLSNKNIMEIQKSNIEYFLICDVMLATGNSFSLAIEILSNLGLESRIILLCINSTPEGVFRLLQEYPNIRIITCNLDEYLNENGYIIKGIGDAGDKYFYQNNLENFEKVKQTFSENQWNYLKTLLE